MITSVTGLDLWVLTPVGDKIEILSYSITGVIGQLYHILDVISLNGIFNPEHYSLSADTKVSRL